MLNYIWSLLLIIGISAALIVDVYQSNANVYGNGCSLNAQVVRFDTLQTENEFSATLNFSKKSFERAYNITLEKELIQQVVIKKDKVKLIIAENTPSIWKQIAEVSGAKNDIEGKILFADSSNVVLVWEEASFLKLKNVTNSALDYAKTAVNIALGLIGIMALWLGIMKIADKAGIINFIAKCFRPFTRFLFPELPVDHPAIGAIIMNMAANMLGLANAATPFGIKAMEELEKGNENKGVASNAMCMFLGINTAGLTLIPATAIAIRSAAGSSNPTIIIGTSIFGAACATITAIVAAKFFESFSFNKRDAVLKTIKLSGFFVLVFSTLYLVYKYLAQPIISGNNFIPLFRDFINFVSILTIPMIILSFITFGLIKKINIYEAFIEGAKEGFNVALKIIPFLVGMLVAIGVFRAGGGMDFLTSILLPITNLIGMPPEALPMALMRPLSGSGSMGIMTEVIANHGADSYLGVLVSTIYGSTETTFYVLAVYFGAVNIKKMRHALPVGILADIAGILGALFIVKLIIG